MLAQVYVHDLDPFLIRFGEGFGLRWYALAYILGFALAYFILRKAVKENRAGGLTMEGLERLELALILGVMVGGRLGFVVQNPERLASDPMFVVRVWEGGMAFFGGLVGVILAVLWAGRREKVSFLALGDLVALPAALGLGFGRIANFINGELPGIPTQADWGVIYPAIEPRVPRHPAELYMSLSHFLLALLLWAAARFWPWFARRPGRVGYLFMAGYGAFRFVTDIFRESDTFWGPLSNNQAASLVVALVGCALLVGSARRGDARVT